MITKKEVEHIAKLARLQLNDNEITKLQKELSQILDYFNLLKKVDTKKEKVELVEKQKKTRFDKALSQPDSVVKKLVEAAPDKKENYIKVKAIL